MIEQIFIRFQRDTFSGYCIICRLLRLSNVILDSCWCFFHMCFFFRMILLCFIGNVFERPLLFKEFKLFVELGGGTISLLILNGWCVLLILFFELGIPTSFL